MSDYFSITNTTKGRIPSCPFELIKNDILGDKYDLSIAFVSEKKSQEYNKTYRGKDKSTNILSFAYSKKEGELIICPAVVKKEAKNFDRNYKNFLGYLVIHGMLHLKGMQHSSRMDKAEEKYDQKYFNRHRLGVSNDKSRGGRILKRRKKS
ncbi:rRNA maturation RNase YbeY [Candidatus Nomurabacteria bacterium]|nr:rRNA maturation RNase YbeY [Candidatus Nomurabacteria bacterium]